MVTMMRCRRDKQLQIQIWDISRAHFCDTAQREIYVDLPEEERSGEHCGLLVKSMYVTQDASAIFQDDYTQVLQNAVYQNGTASPTTVESWCMEMTSAQRVK